MTVTTEQLKFGIPYLNHITQDVEYTEFEGAAIYDSNSGKRDLGNWVALFSLINKLNPDWLNVVDPARTVNVPNLTGEGFIPYTAAQCVSIFIDEKPPDLNYFWNSHEFSKYGLMFWVSTRGMLAPVQWLNMPTNHLICPIRDSIGIYYNFYDGVRASAQLEGYPPAVAVTLGAVPPCAFYSPSVSMPFLTLNDTPVNFGNHEKIW